MKFIPMQLRVDVVGTRPVIVVIGPTGVGKTALGMAIGHAFPAEIISADSRQVYIGMDIGTAKPTAIERRQVVHHMIDILDPTEKLSVVEFQSRAQSIIGNLHGSNKIPVVVGGTGQYVRALTDGWIFPPVAPSPELRLELQSYSDKHGSVALHKLLQAADPLEAAHIDSRNVRRVIRALEIVRLTGAPVTPQRLRVPPTFPILQLGLTRPRTSLYRQIDDRIDNMVESGLVEEVRRLIDAGYRWDLPSMSSLGYRQIGAVIRGETSLSDAVVLIRRATRDFIRKQYNWFRLSDSKIHWFDLTSSSFGEIVVHVRNWLHSTVDSG